MNETEIRDLARLSNQLYYEVVEHGRVITPDLCAMLYTLIRNISLVLLSNIELNGKDDAMLRLLIVVETLNLLARDLPQHSAELQLIATHVDRFRTHYGSQTVNG